MNTKGKLVTANAGDVDELVVDELVVDELAIVELEALDDELPEEEDVCVALVVEVVMVDAMDELCELELVLLVELAFPMVGYTTNATITMTANATTTATTGMLTADLREPKRTLE